MRTRVPQPLRRLLPRRASVVPRSFRGRLAALAALGFGLRLVYVLVLSPDLRGRGDSRYFHALANLLADGHGFASPLALEHGRVEPTALHPPLLPLVLGATSKLGLDSYLAHRGVGCVLGAAAIVAVGALGRRVAGERIGLAAAAVAALYPALIAADGAVMSETLAGLLIAVALLAAYRAAQRPGTGSLAALGATIGAAALARSEALLLLVLLALPLALWLRGPWLRRLAVAFLACGAVVAPWVARNWIVFDRPVAISTNEGNLVAGANCRSTYFGDDIGSWDIRCVRGAGEDEAAAAAIFRRRGLDYATAHPERLPPVAAARVLRTFGLYQPFLHAERAEGREPAMEKAGTLAFYLLAPFALYGAVVLRRRRALVWPLAAPVALVVLVSVVAYGVPRFRHPADLVIAVLAAAGIDALVREGSARRVSRRAARRPGPPAPARRSPPRAPGRAAGGPAA